MPAARHRRPVIFLLAFLTVPSFSFEDRLPFTQGETFTFGIEWRLIRAGRAKLAWEPLKTGTSSPRQATLEVESTGLVSKLYKVNDTYTANMGDKFCAQNTHTIAHEGFRNRETSVTYDAAAKKGRYIERDLGKNTTIAEREVDIPDCVHEIIGALYKLREIKLAPGQTVEIPVSDGKKMIAARVEGQEREQIKTPAGTFHAIRYEAFLFNNVLYQRSGRLYLWLTDDDRRWPVQFRVRLQFHIGTITLQLEKTET